MLYFNLWMVVARLTTAIANNESLTFSSLVGSLPISGEEVLEVICQIRKDIASGVTHPGEKMMKLIDRLDDSGLEDICHN